MQLFYRTCGHPPPDQQPDFKVMITDDVGTSFRFDMRILLYYGPVIMALLSPDGIYANAVANAIYTGKTGQPSGWILLPISGRQFILNLKCVHVLIIPILAMLIYHPIAVSLKFKPLCVRVRIALFLRPHPDFHIIGLAITGDPL